MTRLPDARDAIRALGGEPSKSSRRRFAAARIIIDGYEYIVTIETITNRDE